MKLFRTKSFTSTTAAAILIAGMSFANAQNAAGPARAGASPSDLNAAVKGTGIHQSGSETKGAAMKKKETKPMNAAQRTTVAPNDPNAKPIGSGSATQSGSQSEKSAMSGSKKGFRYHRLQHQKNYRSVEPELRAAPHQGEVKLN